MSNLWPGFRLSTPTPRSADICGPDRTQPRISIISSSASVASSSVPRIGSPQPPAGDRLCYISARVVTVNDTPSSPVWLFTDAWTWSVKRNWTWPASSSKSASTSSISHCIVSASAVL
jgi:hypothetical protein